MRSPVHTVLALLLCAAACGGAAGGAIASPPAVGMNASAAPVDSTAPPIAPGAPALSSVGSTPSAPSAPSAAPSASVVATVEMKPPVPTAYADDLKALGLDPGKLPPMAKLEPKALRGVMKLLAKSLGAKCGDCHQEGDFAAPTPRKKVAAKMWDQFAAKLSFDDGTPLFCDSCHQGRVKQLDRTDKKALSKWMDASFVVKLKRRDGKDHGCETCHVDMDMQFLASWAK